MGRAWRRSIGARIILLFLGLLLAVQLASFAALRASLTEHAHRVLPTRLLEGERLLQNLLDRRSQAVTDGAQLLAADYGFREALATNDADTIVSVLANHGARIGATESALLSTDFKLRATTATHPRELTPVAAHLAAHASAEGHASGIALFDGRPFQAVLVPVKSPLLVGWVLMAFPLDAKLAHDLLELSGLDLTLLSRAGDRDPWEVDLTSLSADYAQGLAARSWLPGAAVPAMTSVTVQGEELGARASALSSSGQPGAGVLALVSLSVDEAVRLPTDLQVALIAINLVGILVFAIGSVFTARRVTTPLRGLANAAERLGGGDYATPMRGLDRQDEIGDLSQSFERMRHSVAANQAQILKLAYWDSLTGLPNRARLRQTLDEAISDATRGASGGRIAVLMLDLNRFKHVNDVLGYGIGDKLLVAIAERLRLTVGREGDVIARLGGDEFAVLLRDADPAQALAVARRVEQSLDVPLAIDEHRVDVGAGIGIACWPQHAQDCDTLLVRAEMAMYAAKRRSNGPMAYDPAIDATSAQTLTLMTELRQAVERHELRLYLQPKLCLADRKVVGAEALVRWQHPQRGLVPPIQFIPFAEQTGFIRVLTMWVFEEAARHWLVLNDEGLQLRLSVNLSTRDLLDPELPQKFEALLARHGVPASAFCLEITESAIMDDPQRALATLDRLSAIGFRLSIDDFGTGYSSLAYLKRLPVDELKIDQSFVRSMQAESDDAMIVRSTVDLAHNLGIVVVAEGVENVEVWNMLRELHCDQAQGFYMGRPMPVNDFPAWAAGWGLSRPLVDGDAPPAHVLH